MAANDVLVVLAGLAALWIYSLIDFHRTDERDMRTFDRQRWIMLLVCFDVVGGLLWLTLGRPRRDGRD
jgi:hypothetical protein